MAIPGFMAEAALYPTSNHYGTLGPVVTEPARRVTVNAQQSSWSGGLGRCVKSCQYSSNTCDFGCNTVWDPWSDYYAWARCRGVCDKEHIACLDRCYGLPT